MMKILKLKIKIYNTTKFSSKFTEICLISGIVDDEENVTSVSNKKLFSFS